MSYFPQDVSADLLFCGPFDSLIRNHRSQMIQGIIPTSHHTQRQILTNTSARLHLRLRLNPTMWVTNLSRICPRSPTPLIPTHPTLPHRVRARIILHTTLSENRRAPYRLTGHNVSWLPAIEPQLT